jgi:hypothetical protein
MSKYATMNEELYPQVENISKIYKKPKHKIKIYEDINTDE